jgi:hypothetical protein
MIRHQQLLATAMLASLLTTACSDTTGPRNEVAPANASAETGVSEISFTKWFTTSPNMTGFTSLGEGTFTGRITKRVPFANGVVVQLGAVYQVRDPNGGHSFTAVIEGTENLQTASAVLNGVVTEGWRAGAQVHVTFDIITPCARATGPSVVGVCFQGTIRIQG